MAVLIKYGLGGEIDVFTDIEHIYFIFVLEELLVWNISSIICSSRRGAANEIAAKERKSAWNIPKPRFNLIFKYN